MAPAQILVLGGGGFIGRAAVREWQARGCGVVSPRSTDLDLCSPRAVDALVPLVDESTTLVVLARARDAGDRWKTFEDDVTIAATVGLLLGRRRLRKCVFASSTSVYGDEVSQLAVTEATPTAPTSPYGSGKLASERIICRAAAQTGTPVLVLRPCMVYGAGDQTQAYGPSTLARQASSGRVSLFGEGEELRPYLFIADAARIIADLTDGGAEGVFNLAPARSHSFAEIVDVLSTLSGRKLEVVRRPRRRPPVDIVVNPAMLLERFPDYSFTGLSVGLAEAFSPSVPA
jgi:UDP-glucose 4-epimerase